MQEFKDQCNSIMMNSVWLVLSAGHALRILLDNTGREHLLHVLWLEIHLSGVLCGMGVLRKPLNCLCHSCCFGIRREGCWICVHPPGARPELVMLSRFACSLGIFVRKLHQLHRQRRSGSSRSMYPYNRVAQRTGTTIGAPMGARDTCRRS